MSKLSGPVLDLIEKFDLSKAFFEANPQKAEHWFLEAQKLIIKNDTKNLGVIAKTGTGKTVIAMLIAIMSGKRTLMLVPNKILAFEHQLTFYLMGGKLQTKVITGNFAFHNRDWNDEDDRIIFATGHVVQQEIEYGELKLDSFDYLVDDEMQYASSERTVYAQISQFETTRRIWRTGLSATPGNKVEKIAAVRKNLKLDEFVSIKIPTPGFVTSVVLVEQSVASVNINYLKAEELILSQMKKCLDVLNETSMKMTLGRELNIDPKKTYSRDQVNLFRAKIREFGNIKLESKQDVKLSKRLASNLEQYAFWAHVYELFIAESFMAIHSYYNNNLLKTKKNTWYAKIIQLNGYAQMLIALTNTLVHPKMEMLGRVALSFKRRGLQFVTFFDNKASALESHFYFESLGIKSDAVFSGKGMTPTVKSAVILKSKEKEIEALNTTDMMREGHNLSVDAVVHYSPPNYPSKMTQRNGRAGRGGKKGEIIYLASENEQWIVPAVTRQVKRLEQMDYSRGSMPPLPRKKRVNPEQLVLFS